MALWPRTCAQVSRVKNCSCSPSIHSYRWKHNTTRRDLPSVHTLGALAFILTRLQASRSLSSITSHNHVLFSATVDADHQPRRGKFRTRNDDDLIFTLYFFTPVLLRFSSDDTCGCFFFLYKYSVGNSLHFLIKSLYSYLVFMGHLPFICLAKNPF